MHCKETEENTASMKPGSSSHAQPCSSSSSATNGMTQVVFPLPLPSPATLLELPQTAVHHLVGLMLLLWLPIAAKSLYHPRDTVAQSWALEIECWF